RVVGPECDGLPDQIHGNVPSSCLTRQHSQHMQDVGVIGLLREDLSVELLGFGQAALLVVLKRDLEKLIEVGSDLWQHSIQRESKKGSGRWSEIEVTNY